MKKTFIILCVVFLFSCKKSHSYPVDLDDETLVIPESDYEDVKYEYRTGQTGNYNYNYDVEGYDDNGNYIEGNIDISNNSGKGYLNDGNGDEIFITVKWSGYGELEAIDDDGNTYELTLK